VTIARMPEDAPRHDPMGQSFEILLRIVGSSRVSEDASVSRRIRFLDSRNSVTALWMVCLSVLVVQGSAQGAGQVSAADRSGVIAFEAAEGLYVVKAAGGTPRRIPSSRPGDGNPRWSPDGKQLAFDRRANENWDVYVMNADGSDQRQLTFSPADDDFAMWAPHGRSLVFNSERDKEPYFGQRRKSVYAVAVATGAARRVTRDGKYPDWSSDGRIMFVGGGDGNQPVFTVRPYGGDRRRLGSLEAVGARVSHDGKRVVYQRGEWTVNRFTDNLYTARIDGTHVQRLAASDEWEGDPNWSPHDDWIVFESSADRGGRYTVYVVESNGGTRTRVMSRHGCCADWTERVAGHAGARAAGATTSLDSAPLRSPGARRRLREMHEHALAEQRPVRGAVLVDATTSRDGDISASADSFAANYRRRAGR